MRRAAAIAMTSLLCAACDGGCDKPAPPQNPELANLAPDATAVGVVNARLGCSAQKEGGFTLEGKLAPDLVTVVAAQGRALVVDASGGKAERGLIGPFAKPEGPMELVTDGRGTDASREPPTWASAARFRGSLATIALGASRATQGPDAGCTDGALLALPVGPGDAAAPTSFGRSRCADGGRFVAAARGDFLVAASNLDLYAGTPGRTQSFAIDAKGGGDVAVAVGETWAAVAWRAAGGDKAATLEVAHLDLEADAGPRLGKPLTLDTGVIGAPALAFEGDTLHVVWTARPNGAGPSALRWSKWTGAGRPTDPQVLTTHGAPASTPALAVEKGGYFLLAWAEGDEKGSVVKAGASRINLLHAVTNATELAPAGQHGRAPAVALNGRTSYVVWAEADADAGRDTLRATTLYCRE